MLALPAGVSSFVSLCPWTGGATLGGIAPPLS
jgi:hypothetical protein